MGTHIVNGEFQSDKYPTCPPGKVPLSVKDESAQDLLWDYSVRRRVVDSEFSTDLQTALLDAGFEPKEPDTNRCTPPYYRGVNDGRVMSRDEWLPRIRACIASADPKSAVETLCALWGDA